MPLHKRKGRKKEKLPTHAIESVKRPKDSSSGLMEETQPYVSGYKVPISRAIYRIPTLSPHRPISRDEDPKD